MPQDTIPYDIRDGEISFDITVDAALENCPVVISLDVTCSRGDQQEPCRDEIVTVIAKNETTYQLVFVADKADDIGDYNIQIQASDDSSGLVSEL